MPQILTGKGVHQRLQNNPLPHIGEKTIEILRLFLKFDIVAKCSRLLNRFFQGSKNFVPQSRVVGLIFTINVLLYWLVFGV